MSDMFPDLFSPLTINNVTLKNRIFSTGHETPLVSGGIPDQKLAAYQEARARGGAALIVTEATSVHETAYSNAAIPTGYLEASIPGFRLVAEAIHRHGARVFGQLYHPGGEMMGMAADGTRLPSACDNR